jgi:hypothetical protein
LQIYHPTSSHELQQRVVGFIKDKKEKRKEGVGAWLSLAVILFVFFPFFLL